MSYSTPHDVIERFNLRLHDPSVPEKGLSREFTTSKITHAIAKADSIINAYLAKRYCVPMDTNIPYLIKAISIDLAFVNLHSEHKPDFVEALELFNLQMLGQLQDGTLSLHAIDEKSNILFESDAPIFNRKNLKAF